MLKKINFMFNSGGKIDIDVDEKNVTEIKKFFNADIDIDVSHYAIKMPEGLVELCIKTRFCEVMFVNDISVITQPNKNIKVIH